MIARKNVVALLEQHGLECTSIDLTPKVEVRHACRADVIFTR